MKQKKRSKFLLMTLLFGITTSLFANSNPSKTNDMITNNETAISAYDLHNAFTKNDSEARRAYTGKTITVTGVSIHVGADSYGLPSVKLSDKANGKTYVLCLLPFTDYMKLRNIPKDATVTFSGECRYIGGDDFVVMKHCRMLNN